MDMKRVLIFLLILFAPMRAAADEQLPFPDTFNRFEGIFLQQDDKGNIWTSYTDMDGYFHMKNVSLKKDFVINDKSGRASTGFTVNRNGDALYIAWIDKTGGRKKLYFRAVAGSGDTISDPVLLDDNQTEALPRIRIGSNSGGNVYVLWYGERAVGKAKYHNYVAVSNDNGMTFSSPQNLTMGYGYAIYPTLLVDEENAYIFSYVLKDKKFYMIFRKTTDNGKTWTDPVVIKETPGTVTTYIKPLKTGNRLYVFWYCTTKQGPVTQKAFSDDGGKTWNSSDYDDLKGISLSYMTAASDAQGHMYFAYSGGTMGQKSNTYIIISKDQGNTWSKPISLRHYPFTTTTTVYPQIIASDDGTVAAVWVDYRNIRSNIYLQYSLDGGETWQPGDIPLEEPGRYNTSYFGYASENFIKTGDTYSILAYRLPADDLSMGEAKLLVMKFSIKTAR